MEFVFLELGAHHHHNHHLDNNFQKHSTTPLLHQSTHISKNKNIRLKTAFNIFGGIWKGFSWGEILSQSIIWQKGKRRLDKKNLVLIKDGIVLVLWYRVSTWSPSSCLEKMILFPFSLLPLIFCDNWKGRLGRLHRRFFPLPYSSSPYLSVSHIRIPSFTREERTLERVLHYALLSGNIWQYVVGPVQDLLIPGQYHLNKSIICILIKLLHSGGNHLLYFRCFRSIDLLFIMKYSKLNRSILVFDRFDIFSIIIKYSNQAWHCKEGGIILSICLVRALLIYF